MATGLLFLAAWYLDRIAIAAQRESSVPLATFLHVIPSEVEESLDHLKRRASSLGTVPIIMPQTKNDESNDETME
jgi:hypothetical protein